MTSLGNVFLNPVMLAGLGAAALPLVLHLLSRARHRSVDWGAMMFLAGADSRQRQSTHVKQWILLLIRMGTVGLLAVALARPIVRGGWTLTGQEGGVTAVIVLDCSASMTFTEWSRSRFDEARQTAMGILDNLRAGDQATLLLMGADQNEDDLRPTVDLESLKRRLAHLQPTARQADVAHALTRAADLLDRHAKFNRETYLVMDQQAVSWRNVDSTFEQSWRDRTRTAGPSRLVVIAVGSQQRENVAVESVAILNPPALVRQAAEVEISVRNFGSVARPAWPVRLMRGNVELLSTTMNLPADSSAQVRAPITFDTVGQHVVAAHAGQAGPSVDDALSVVVSVSDPIRVLILSGDERAEPFDSESDYLRAALMPFAVSGQAGADPAQVDVVPADKWSDVDIHDYAVVVLANVSQITPVQARDLTQFALEGGGVLITTGNLSRARNYNQLLADLLPAALIDVGEEPVQPTQIASLDLRHPIFRFLNGAVASSPPTASIANHLRAVPRENVARVLSTYRDGSPFLLESSVGRGRVILMTTSIDADWNALPLSNFYLPFAQSAIRYLSADESARHNLMPGQPIEWSFDAPRETFPITVETPGGAKRAAEVRRMDGRDNVRFGDTSEPGLYTLSYTSAQAEQSAPFVVRSPFDESDLTPLSQPQWIRLSAALRFERAGSDAISLAKSTSGARTARELWPVLLAAIGALAVAELLLARLWSEEDRA